MTLLSRLPGQLIGMPNPLRPRWGVARQVGVVLLGVLVLAGCGAPGGGDAGQDQVTSPAPSGSAGAVSDQDSVSLAEVLAAYPSPAGEQTPAGGAAFVEYFIEVYNDTATTNESLALARISSSTCDFCKRAIGAADARAGDGQRYDVAPLAVTMVEVAPGATAPMQYYTMRWSQVGASVVGADGSVVSTDAQREGSSDVNVIWDGDRWLMDGLQTT